MKTEKLKTEEEPSWQQHWNQGYKPRAAGQVQIEDRQNMGTKLQKEAPAGSPKLEQRRKYNNVRALEHMRVLFR